MPRSTIRIYKAEESLRSRRKKLRKNPRIDTQGKKVILAFLDHLGASGLSAHRRNFYISHLKAVAELMGPAFTNPTKMDIERTLSKIEQSGYAYWTKVNYRTAIKRFYKWHLGNDEVYPECVRWVKTKTGGNSNHKLPEDLLSQEEIDALVKACHHPRDKALISLLADSGCRISEILTLRWGNVVFDRYGAVLTVRGKTGPRRVRVIGDSIPHLLSWKDVHPLRGQRDAPVFVGLNSPSAKQGRPDEALTYPAARRVVRMAAERAGIRKRVHPHLFRHTKATQLAKNVPEAPLEAQMGWVPGSSMTRVYVHLSGRDTDAAILRAHGITVDDPGAEEAPRPRICPRCEMSNVSDARFCRKCGMALVMEAAVETDRVRESIMEAVVHLSSDKRFQRLLEQALARQKPPGVA